jgi:uncharacterized coiled-coil protein SlyX
VERETCAPGFRVPEERKQVPEQRENRRIHGMSTPQGSGADEQLLERMEAAIAHLQHDLDAVNQSLLAFLRRIQEFESRFIRLEQEFQSMTEGSERRDPAVERPPHY